MKDLASIDFKDNIRFVVRRYLKTMGIKVSKQKSVKIQVSEFDGGVREFCLILFVALRAQSLSNLPRKIGKRKAFRFFRRLKADLFARHYLCS